MTELQHWITSRILVLERWPRGTKYILSSTKFAKTVLRTTIVVCQAAPPDHKIKFFTLNICKLCAHILSLKLTLVLMLGTVELLKETFSLFAVGDFLSTTL